MSARVDHRRGPVPSQAGPRPRRRKSLRVEMIDVHRIRPEEGLKRKRDRVGHQELCTSILQFGVLTPITVRPAPDGSGDYLLVKGQGRTLACHRLGLRMIPAVVVDADFDEADKVQQFLLENVARLKMRPVDRALLVTHARQQGEETADVARRFGVSAATVRRLESQFDGVSSGEIAALRAGNISLSLHAAIMQHVLPGERADIVAVVASHPLRAQEAAELFDALGWASLNELGPEQRRSRLALFAWCCATFAQLPKGHSRNRLEALASQFPFTFEQSVIRAASR
jgi:ParB/RepB/Spo0J family partition protein